MGAIDRDLDAASPTMFELVPNSAAALSLITRGLPREGRMASLTPRAALRAARTHFRGDVGGWLEVDREVSARVIQRVRGSHFRGNGNGRRAAQFVFAAFTGVDKTSHATGHAGPRVVEALRIVDDTAAALRDCLERSGEWERSRIWITSDHGHSRVRQHEDLERVVTALGHRVLAHPWVYRVRPDAAVMVSGNAMAHVYVDLNRRTRPFKVGFSESAQRLADALLERESVDLMLVPLDATRCEVRSHSRGTAIVTRVRGRYSYDPADGDPLELGSRARDLDAAAAHEITLQTDYPDSLVQVAAIAAAGRSGDLILSAARDWDFRARFEPIPHLSAHGALHREHITVPLLLSGPVAGRPRRTADVMPSALSALGIDVPPGLDGESFEARAVD